MYDCAVPSQSNALIVYTAYGTASLKGMKMGSLSSRTGVSLSGMLLDSLPVYTTSLCSHNIHTLTVSVLGHVLAFAC